ncbi:nitrile hydratase subunit alpha [Paraburkholderia sp. GAS41]|uniref:nitrile hydratase subunit alpha n=1 Tax=Paraburkholderia sp. GAS41 TaxID=3035134 RepID=UPI003D1E3446
MEIEWNRQDGARVVARAWVDPAFRELLLRDGTAACKEFGYFGPQGEYTGCRNRSKNGWRVSYRADRRGTQPDSGHSPLATWG